MTTRAAIVEEARRWMGTPFLHQASLRGVGCDCIGMLVGVMDAKGLPEAQQIKADPRFHGYGRTPDGTALKAACSDYADEIQVDQAIVGDAFLFTFLRDPMHLAIVSHLNPLRIIHAYAPIGRVVEHGVDEKWRRRLIAAYRLRGVE